MKLATLLTLTSITSVPLASQSFELGASWSGIRVEGYGPFDSSRTVAVVGICGAFQSTDYPFIFIRGQLIPSKSSNELNYQGLSFGTEFRLENPDWYWGAGLGIDARIERIEQQSFQKTVWSPLPHQVQVEGFSKTVFRPMATFSLQYPGILLYIPLAKIGGPLQPITRFQVEWSPLRPKSSGAAGEFLQHLDPIQYAVQVGFRFR